MVQRFAFMCHVHAASSAATTIGHQKAATRLAALKMKAASSNALGALSGIVRRPTKLEAKKGQQQQRALDCCAGT